MTAVPVVPTDPEARIAVLSGPYNLPDGVVPHVDGVPRWPWDDAVAHQRLRRVAQRMGRTLTGDEVLLESASNDVWSIGGDVLRVCWRGDVDRLLREAAVITALPESVPCPRPLECGRDEYLSWTLAPRVRGSNLADGWMEIPGPQLREYILQVAEMVSTLHAWTPPARVLHLLRVASADDADDAVTITGKTTAPLSPAQHATLIDYLRTMPYVDHGLLDAVADWLAVAHERLAVHTFPRAVLHGDLAPTNILVNGGRVAALIDYEWTRFGPRDAELNMPAVWADWQPREARADRLIAWLHDGYPDLFAARDLDERLWLYRIGFALRCSVHWPPDQPEEGLPPTHPVRLLRELAGDRAGS